MSTALRILSGGHWTVDGRWVVVGTMYGREVIVFDPRTGDASDDVLACIRFAQDIG